MSWSKQLLSIRKRQQWESITQRNEKEALIIKRHQAVTGPPMTTSGLIREEAKSVDNLQSSNPALPLRSSSKSDYNIQQTTTPITNGIMQGQVWLPAIPIMFANSAGQVMMPHNGQKHSGKFFFYIFVFP